MALVGTKVKELRKALGVVGGSNIVKAYLVDTEHELLFREEAQEGKAELGPWKEKKLQDWFYRQLLSHPKLNGAGNQGALDTTTTGAKWMTAKGLFAT